MLPQFISILEKSKEGDLVTFLKSLTDEQKKKLVPDIKRLYKEYTDYKEVSTVLGKTTWAAKGTEKQKNILLISSFVCFNRQDYERTSFPGWILDETNFRKIMDWYIPSWFNDFVNKLAQQDVLPYTVNYKWALELANKGFLTLSKEIVVKLLPQIIFENERGTHFYKPEKALEYPITLQEHIWHLFELESDIHYCNRWLNFGNADLKKVKGWIELFKQYSAEGRIERIRLLQQALLASNKNFNNQLSGWFSELFIDLEPTAEELLNLQKEMFSVLSSPQSKPVNTVLQHLKKIVPEKKFDGVSFLNSAPVLFSSDKKNTLVSTISILEKLAKKNKALQLPACKALLPVFIHANDEVQQKAAKIISAYQSICDEEFTESLQPYQASLMMSARNLLADFFTADLQPDAEQAAVDTTGDAMAQKEILQEIPVPQSMDDLIFLASQAFDNNQAWHIDILPNAILTWQHELRGQNIARLEPALQRALQMTKSEFRTGQGSLDHMLAIFFIDVCVMLARKFSAEAEAILVLFTKFDQNDGRPGKQWMAISNGNYYLTGWDNHAHDPFYLIHKHLLLAVLQKITAGDYLPLLSVPTHEPGYILPETLVHRILLYQQKNKVPFNIDAQVAVSRCLLMDKGSAIKMAEEQLQGEYKNLLLFLFDKQQAPQGPFINQAVWMCASVAKKEKKIHKEFAAFSYYKNPFASYTGLFLWKNIEEEYDQHEYSFAEKKTITKKAKRKLLRVNINREPLPEKANLKKILSNILHKQPQDAACLYDYLSIKSQWPEFENDVRRIILLTPNNPEPFLAEVTKHCFTHPTFLSEADKRTVIASLQLLYEIWNDFGEMAYLFLACSIISSDKTVKNIAAEIWLKAVSAGKMNNELLGNIIGQLESNEFAPIKRLTDLANQSLFRVSALHNKNLITLIENILIQIPQTPIANLKKLLELYLELLAINNIGIINQQLQQKLNTWATISGIQKIIKSIIDKRRVA